MKLTVVESDAITSEPIVILNSDDCLNMGVGSVDRVRVTADSTFPAAVMMSDVSITKGYIGLSPYLMERCGAKEGEKVDVEYCPMPGSIRSIRAKINGASLDYDEIDSIVQDIMKGNLSEKEIIAFVSAFNTSNSDLTEVAYLTRAMASTGRNVDLGVKPVFDFHSLGGVPGNKITPIVVSIVASEGLVIPKLSSRAVSSACGTSDYVDVFCDVEMDSDKLVSTINKVGGVFACGNEDYAPVGSLIIKAERPMGIDPRPTMMASIMSKKVVIGTTHLLVDVPMGEGSKIEDRAMAEEFARNLRDLGTILGIHVECAVTRADQPIGRMIGPVLEAKECIGILENGTIEGPVADKACGLAGIILEMAGEKDGKAKAQKILSSGKAHRKFMEIVKEQNGDPNLRSEDLIPGAFVKDVHAKRDGYVQYADSRAMVAIAKGAGAPDDIGAGIEMLHRKGDYVKTGDTLFRIYADNEGKLARAVESARSRRPMYVCMDQVGKISKDMIIERIPSKEMLDLIRYANRKS